MKKTLVIIATVAFVFGGMINTYAQCGVAKKSHHVQRTSYSGGHKDIVEVALSDDNFSTLVKAVVTADLATTLKSEGPFTVFAPTNSSFAKLPSGTVENLLKPSSKNALTGILTYHVLPGKFKAADIVKAIELGGGTAFLGTVAGGKLKAMIKNGDVVLQDENGGISKIAATDVNASNGVIHVIESVVLPKG